MEAWLWILIPVFVVGAGALVLTHRSRAPRPLVELAEDEPLPSPRAIPLVDVPPDEALAALPRPIRACPDCGYVGIRAPSLSEGGMPGAELLTRHVCPHCRYEGPPAEFDTGEDYQEYVESLRRAWRKKDP